MHDKKFKSLIDKILESATFSKSKVYKELLTYLYNATNRGEQPKEVTIAIDLFNRDESFSPVEDSIVRFHIYKLRKKLKEYYNKEGENEQTVVQIPKGKYILEFGNRKALLDENNSHISLWYSISAILFILFCLICYLYWTRPVVQRPVPKNNVMWKSVFSNGFATNIVIGDFFVFEEFDKERKESRRIMDYYVNTLQDFEKYQQEYPNRRPKRLELGELPHDSIYNLQDITHVFYSYEKKYDLIMASNVTVADFKEQNFIYLGTFKNMGQLQIFFDVIPLKIHPITDGSRAITFFNQKGDTLRSFKSESLWDLDSYNSDFGLIAKLPGYNNEQMIFICGFGYFSKIDLGRMLSSKAGLKKMENILQDNFDNIPPYFIMVFQMFGKKYTGYTSKLQYAREIDATLYKQSLYHLFSQE